MVISRRRVRISEQAADDGRALHKRALGEGWEGLIVKEVRAPYQSGPPQPGMAEAEGRARTGVRRRRLDRAAADALVLRCVAARRARREDRCADLCRTHGNGLRSGRARTRVEAPESARDPAVAVFRRSQNQRVARTGCGPISSHRCGSPNGPPTRSFDIRCIWVCGTTRPRRRSARGIKGVRPGSDRGQTGVRPGSDQRRPRSTGPPRAPASLDSLTSAVVAQLRALEDARRDGTIEFPDGDTSRRDQPRQGLLAQIEADERRPAPLLRRGLAVHPSRGRGSTAGHEALSERRDRAWRSISSASGSSSHRQACAIETIAGGIDPILEGDEQRFIGGSLITLLYMTQIAAISQDPWFSRVQSPLEADYAAIDLDPDDHTPFSQVLEVARWVHDELETLGVPAVPKTSGSSGLHIYVPLPPEHVVRIRAALLPDRRDRRRVASSESRHRRAHGAETPARNGLRGLSAEHSRQDARDGVQRPRERVRRRLDAADVGRGRTRASIHRTSRSRRRRRDSARLVICGRGCATSKPANLETVFRRYKKEGI